MVRIPPPAQAPVRISHRIPFPAGKKNTLQALLVGANGSYVSPRLSRPLDGPIIIFYRYWARLLASPLLSQLPSVLASACHTTITATGATVPRVVAAPLRVPITRWSIRRTRMTPAHSSRILGLFKVFMGLLILLLAQSHLIVLAHSVCCILSRFSFHFEPDGCLRHSADVIQDIQVRIHSFFIRSCVLTFR